ncbi:MAG: hypothetical protein NC548_37270 [Lachnospiraceae bacterium]|nr:hypothetical protein [Lachnospiraceae bacterium]
MQNITKVVNNCWNPTFVSKGHNRVFVTFFMPHNEETNCELVEAIIKDTGAAVEVAESKLSEGMDAVIAELGVRYDEFLETYGVAEIDKESEQPDSAEFERLIGSGNGDLKKMIEEYDASHEKSLKDFFIGVIAG